MQQQQAAVAYLCEGLSYRTRDPTTHHQWWMLNLLARKCLRFYFPIFYKYTAVVVVGGYCVVCLSADLFGRILNDSVPALFRSPVRDHDDDNTPLDRELTNL